MGGTDPATRGPGGMHVEESGTPGSPAIVFIHGAGQSGREWRQHMASLTDFHCLAPDLPGFGRSNQLPSASFSQTADLVARAHRAARPGTRASVVGISSGGMVSTRCCAVIPTVSSGPSSTAPRSALGAVGGLALVMTR